MKAVSGRQFCKALERHGWTLARTRGRHRRYEKAGCLPITVPVHGNRSLKKGPPFRSYSSSNSGNRRVRSLACHRSARGRFDLRPRSCPNGKACLSQYAACIKYAARQRRGDAHGAYNPLHAAWRRTMDSRTHPCDLHHRIDPCANHPG